MNATGNQLPKITDFEKAIFLAQYAYENGFRGSSAQDLYNWIIGKIDISQLVITAGLPDPFPEPNDNLSVSQEGQWTILAKPGTYYQPGYDQIQVNEGEIVLAQSTNGDYYDVVKKIDLPNGDMLATEWAGTSADAGLTYPVVRAYQGKLYRVKDGETTTVADVPGESNKWELVGGNYDFLEGEIEGIEERSVLTLGDFTAQNGATLTFSDSILRISNDASVGWAIASINSNIETVEFQMTSNGYWNPSPNWLGVGMKGDKIVALNIRTSDAQRGYVYATKQGFGVDSELLKNAFDVDNGAYTLASGDWVRAERVGKIIKLYKKISETWVHLGTSDLSESGVTSFGFKFLNTYHSAATSNLNIASNVTAINNIIGIKQRLEALEENQSEPAKEIDLGYFRRLTLDDIAGDINGTSSIVGNDLKLKGNGGGVVPVVYLDSNIKGIEFTVPSVLTDGTQYSFIVSKKSVANIFSYISLRNVATAPYLIDLFTSPTNNQAIDGSTRMAAPNGKPEKTPAIIESGDRLRFLAVGDKLHCWIKKSGSSEFEKNFVIDKRSQWLVPDREGFQGEWTFGVCRAVMTSSTDDITVFQNLNVLDYSINGEVTEIYKELAEKATQELLLPKAASNMKWVAIGDSITEADELNRKGFLGFANEQLGYNLINKGFGGWTIYKLWRDREIGRTTGTPKAGWASEIEDADLVTISAGTNDFDTTFYIPTSDSDMDSHPDPHPRFGTFDKEDSDFKNPHTTLGALRLMIEYILSTAPQARVVVITPMYRLKKSISGGTIVTWTVNDEGRTVKDYADAIAKVASEYNLEVVDFYNAGVNEYNIDLYMYDKLHTNEFGARHFGNILYNKLRY